MELLWRRALADDGEKLYCLVNGDLLDYDVSQKAVDCLHTLMQDYSDNEGKLFFFEKGISLLLDMGIQSRSF